MPPHHEDSLEQWRRTYNPSTIPIKQLPPWLRAYTVGPTAYLYVQWQHFEPGLEAPYTVLEAVAAVCDEWHRTQPDRVVIVGDYEKWELRQRDPPLMLRVLKIFKEYQVDFTMVLINVPWHFRLLWALLSPFVSNDLARRLVQLDVAELDQRVGCSLPQLQNAAPWSQAGDPSAPPSLFQRLAEQEVTSDWRAVAQLLEKRGAGGVFGTKRWKTKWVAVVDGMLVYAEDLDGRGLQVLPLVDPTLSDVEGQDGRPHCCSLSCGDGTRLLLAAPSQNALTQFHEAVLRAGSGA